MAGARGSAARGRPGLAQGRSPLRRPARRSPLRGGPAADGVGGLIACVDVDYRDTGAVAAGVWFRGWSASEAETEGVATFGEVAPYQPGEFYRRELPCLLEVLARGPAADVVVIDGYVWLGPGRAGLGAHLHAALDGQVVVVGVAKTRFAGATDAVPVYRGSSRSPLYVTAAGVSAEEAAGWVAGMHGAYRLPTMLKRADRLAGQGPKRPKGQQGPQGQS